MIQLTTDTAGDLLLDSSEVSSYLNLDDSYPELITLMKAVQDKAEAYCGRSFTARTLKLRLDEIPSDGIVELPMSPVTSITSVSVPNEFDDDLNVTATTYYMVDDYRLYFKELPETRRDFGGILITYVTGDATKVPDAVKVGMYKALSTIFEHREDFVVGTTVISLPNESKTFLDSYRKIC